MARSTPRAGDFTGKQKAALSEKHAAEQEARSNQIALATAEAAAAQDTETVDLVPRKEEVKQEKVGEVAVQDVDVEEPIVEFRVTENLEMVTIGQGNHYDFAQGQKYKAPKHIYDHLEEKGLIWH